MWSPAYYIGIFLFVMPWQQDQYTAKREKMVKQQIERRGVKDPVVLKAMRTVKRHEFVPAGQIGNAYDDRPLPIGYGQTISQPYIVAYMTEIIKPQSNFKVLEIGTGSGYQAAILSAIVKEVYTIEIIPELGKSATEKLRKDCKNVQVKTSDGYNGWQEHAPYDAIVVTAAAEHVPPPLIRQLKDGGKMVIPVGSSFMTQMLILVEKKKDSATTKNLIPVAFVPLTRRK
ncbi:protein-L-isoaspartate(D-aspartate) O-methyltransferase [Niastella caeni]|uniref:Protein-L-isoaspartate O-methyltransferase n=1 Tax=Niastella caeni TaxID=2569763 RepID=A0A4S8HSD6_9BACT|nr:protein-L-isoaspartate(D-aspartate) O-methyltransferase [Niastella caeni]THU38370.1 protein-L-isoaspartate(D-aspartate) O-methyltransferase [Niastella caeni]